MEYRTFCKKKVSALGFGCMRFKTKGRKIDREASSELLEKALESGINYFDTAWMYHSGESEEFLGDFISSNNCRNEVYIADKLPCMIIRSAGKFQEYLDKQLVRLKTDYIDFYLMHALSGPVWDKMVSYGILDFIKKIRDEGVVKHIGFSFHGAPDDFIRIVDALDWEFVQIQYNFMDEKFQAGKSGLRYAAAKGMDVVIMEPLRGGALVNVPKEVEKIYKAADITRSPAEWAFKWLYNQPEVTVVLSGMNEIDHLVENVRIVSDTPVNSLSENDINIIDLARDKYIELFKVGCTECRYCMPCPAGINIPECFKNFNSYHMFDKRSAQFMHILFAGIHTGDGTSHFTSACINCGKCEEACPQGIKIREEFKNVHRVLEGVIPRTAAFIGRIFLNRKKR